jgi:prepilin-type N-terminal cleavage/methylation domain-containing protein
LGYSADNMMKQGAGFASARRPRLGAPQLRGRLRRRSGHVLRSWRSREAGFTLVEVLVALVVLLIGAYVALRIFPSGFAAIERARQESLAARLADQEIQRWQLAMGSLPEAIVWAYTDLTTGELTYRTEYDSEDVLPNAGNPNWEPNSAYRPRTVLGEVLAVGDVTDPGTGGIKVPLCRLRFGPLQHLYDAPYDDASSYPDHYPVFIYTTRYERVDRADFLSGVKDWGRYHIDYDRGTISFDFAPYERRFRVEFTYMTSAAPGAEEPRRPEMSQIAELITVPAGWDTRPANVGAGPGRISLWPGTQQIEPVTVPGAQRTANVVTITTTAAHGFSAGQGVVVSDVTAAGASDFTGIFVIASVPSPTTFTYDQNGADDTGGGGTVGPVPADFRGVVPLSERVHQAFVYDGSGTPTGPGHFTLGGNIDQPDSYLLFDPGDAGRTVNVDYRVRDWEILLEERVPDDTLQVQLTVSPIKGADYTNPPRQPNPDRIVSGDPEMVIIVDAQDGTRLANFTVDYNTGRIHLGPSAQVGKTYRIYYRSEQDWTIQPLKAAADYAIIVGASAEPGYRFAVWLEPSDPRMLEFGRSEVAKSVVANYYMYTDAPDNTNPQLVVGELHQIDLESGHAVVRLAHDPAWGDIRVRGASMSARVLWAGRGSVRAVGGELSPESWRQVTVESFLRRP